MLKHYVKFDIPGFFFAESETKEVDNRIPANIKSMPKAVFGLHFYDQEVILSQNVLCDNDIEFEARELGMKEVCENCEHKFKCITKQGEHKITGKSKNESVKILFGKRYSVAELKARNDPELRVLISNLEGNGYPYGVHCITQNWQWAEENDIVIPSYADLSNLTEEI